MYDSRNGRMVAAPRFLEGLLEAMLQSFYDRFGGLSKLTEGWTGVYMADGGGRMRTRTAMLEKSWLPRSLEGADASFWPANVCLFIFPGLRVSFCFWVRGLTLFFLEQFSFASSIFFVFSFSVSFSWVVSSLFAMFGFMDCNYAVVIGCIYLDK